MATVNDGNLTWINNLETLIKLKSSVEEHIQVLKTFYYTWDKSRSNKNRKILIKDLFAQSIDVKDCKKRYCMTRSNLNTIIGK